MHFAEICKALCFMSQSYFAFLKYACFDIDNEITLCVLFIYTAQNCVRYIKCYSQGLDTREYVLF